MVTCKIKIYFSYSWSQLQFSELGEIEVIAPK